MNSIIPDRVGLADVFPDEIDAAQPGSTKTPLSAGEPRVHLKPLHDRVLVRRFAAAPAINGIIVPDVARQKPLTGIVVAVGPGKRHSDGVFRETMVKPGDLVMFAGSVNLPYPDLVKEGDLVMMAEADILGIIG